MTNIRFGIILALIVAASTSTDAFGQWYAGPQVGGVSYPGLGVHGYGYGYGGWGSAQTPMSANAIGMSSLVRAEGSYNEQTSRAMVNAEQARSAYIDNQQKYFNARQSIKRAAKAQDAVDNEAAHAALARADEFLAAHQPLPLPSSELHPSTGQISWPTALQAPEFAENRKALETLFESRLKTGLTANSVVQIEKKTNELKDQLREHIMKMPLADYSQARRFLDSMLASAR